MVGVTHSTKGLVVDVNITAILVFAILVLLAIFLYQKVRA